MKGDRLATGARHRLGSPTRWPQIIFIKNRSYVTSRFSLPAVTARKSNRTTNQAKLIEFPTKVYIYVYCSESYLLQKWRRSNAGWFLHRSSSFTPFHVTRLLMADLPSSFHARRNGRDPRTIHRGRRSTGTLFTMEDRHPPEPLARVVSSSWSRTLRPKNSPVSAVFVDLHEMNEARLFRYRCWCSDAMWMDETMVVDPCVGWGTVGMDVGRDWRSRMNFLNNEFVIGKGFYGCVVRIVLEQKDVWWFVLNWKCESIWKRKKSLMKILWDEFICTYISVIDGTFQFIKKFF